ncbi:hypothetical protein OPV22_015136 [Ensete ventricosum]|uniref:Uncharacterized protein n=1 Tax=Ensete ventricosum TaxID=4639 RepID=A0AAV8R968_ENSVE|nr:hypothetical protein OPV22_015136 [Ensete ventricosum]
MSVVWVGDLGSAGRLTRLATPPPYLSEEESVLVGRLKGILSSSCAIKEMTELWLAETGWISGIFVGCRE